MVYIQIIISLRVVLKRTEYDLYRIKTIGGILNQLYCRYIHYDLNPTNKIKLVIR